MFEGIAASSLVLSLWVFIKEIRFAGHRERPSSMAVAGGDRLRMDAE